MRGEGSRSPRSGPGRASAERPFHRGQPQARPHRRRRGDSSIEPPYSSARSRTIASPKPSRCPPSPRARRGAGPLPSERARSPDHRRPPGSRSCPHSRSDSTVIRDSGHLRALSREFERISVGDPRAALSPAVLPGAATTIEKISIGVEPSRRFAPERRPIRRPRSAPEGWLAMPRRVGRWYSIWRHCARPARGHGRHLGLPARSARSASCASGTASGVLRPCARSPALLNARLTRSSRSCSSALRVCDQRLHPRTDSHRRRAAPGHRARPRAP